MKYKSFRIRNFKGIRDTKVELQGLAGASVFAFVGLNESGKTTVLEAIHSFSPDGATSELLSGVHGVGVPFRDRVPRHLISEFTGEASVTATLSVTDEDRQAIHQSLKKEYDIAVDKDSIPDEVVFERKQIFERGDYKSQFFSLLTPVRIKLGKERRWRDLKFGEFAKVRDAFYSRTPDIAYFPTFVFDFPKVIHLSKRGSNIDEFYRRVFQDILDHDGRGHTIDADIVGRVRNKAMQVPWLEFFDRWRNHDDKAKIQHVMDRASGAVTKMVFDRWNKIFKEEVRGKEIIISFDVEQGEIVDARGNRSKTLEHDVAIRFQIRDGSRRFYINDRSLGFRWFFSFMLFTQFRVARTGSDARPLLFLFDEPASNLHSAAQQKLIDSFPSIARGEHVLAYTTHSHYMIEPKWLEQTFIVTNRTDAPLNSILDDVSLDDESLDVKVTSYRSFVNDHPSQTSYFQPILDRLEVVPSKLDFDRSSVILEGKSDYYILKYCGNLTGNRELALVPCLGAGTFNALAALHIGWSLNFIFLLDGDRQGKIEQARYGAELGISNDRLITLPALIPSVVVIEDLLDEEAFQKIRSELKLTTKPTKSQVRRFFQERLASDNITDLSPGFRKLAAELLERLGDRLSSFKQEDLPCSS